MEGLVGEPSADAFFSGIDDPKGADEVVISRAAGRGGTSRGGA